MKSVPDIRVKKANEAPVNQKGEFVLYWMIACRRTSWNYGLDRAVAWAAELNKPLVILEALRTGYLWVSDRLHAFILNGMAENARSLADGPVTYYPYVEMKTDAGKGLLQALADKACVVVTDDFPAFFLPRMTASIAPRLPVLMEKVDANGLLPMRTADRVFPTAYAFRRFLQKHLPAHLVEHPKQAPFNGVRLKRLKTLPKEILNRWPMATDDVLEPNPGTLSGFPIDHTVDITETRGGPAEALVLLEEFIESKLSDYEELKNQPEADATSRLSPYLHFGHISAHQIFQKIIEKEEWFFDRLAPTAKGNRSGWWGMSASAEAFLDQLITWRELGFNMCRQRTDYDQYHSLPDWAKNTLKAHEPDPREYVYSLEEFEQARTHDRLWNAAQMELITEGRIHNYLRMLWGKKIFEWSETPKDALNVMIELNNKYALDGRDPNSYSGIFWCLGRYDRAWGPERRIFGKIRYMTSKNTARKVDVRYYMEKYAP
ncbi:MAG: deoxyribodipyrimidine photolyase [Deltaproteobacteria bacterium]|nr:deoxyribodipyrimidine photolyase [Deltaproteobacteria bacterium]